VPSSMCHTISAVSPPDIDTSHMEMSKRTGSRGRGINTGKSMGEGNGMERSGGTMTRMITIEAEEGTKIKPVLVNANESTGEIVQCAYFSSASS